MTKIKFDPMQQEVEISRRMGRGSTQTITVSRESAEAGINLGFGSIRITTDYGGAISLGIGGQEITWGREGGRISFGIGGFEVYVEARNCVVVETKSIFGQIVAQRSYPDPGCKLPDPPIPPEPPEPPQSPNGIDPTTITDTKNGYILLGQYHYSVVYSYKNPWFPKETEKETIAFI